MTTQHTPGPWRTSDNGEWTASYDGLGSSCYQGIKDEFGNVVALAVAHDPNLFSDPDTYANARLIAAAPDLLEALKNLLESHYNGNVIKADCAEAEAAIAKATGQE